MRMKREHRASQRWRTLGCGKRMKRRKSKRWRTRDSYTPPKRRVARACALPDEVVAVSACGLAVWSLTVFNMLTTTR